ncbi:MAG: hypothetical protein ACLS7Z_01715 [Christensenellales bacterium]
MNDIHPDLALLAQPERRAICCLCVESAGQNLSGLLEKKPFSRYVENGETALLFDEAERSVALERADSAKTALRGDERPFALPLRARCRPKRALRWKRQSACARTHAV